MLITVGWITVVNTKGENSMDINSKYGPPIMMMIIAAALFFPNLFFIIA